MKTQKEIIFYYIAILISASFISEKYENAWIFCIFSFSALNLYLHFSSERNRTISEEAIRSILFKINISERYLSDIRQILLNHNNGKKTDPDELFHLDEKLVEYFRMTEDQRSAKVNFYKELREFGDMMDKAKKEKEQYIKDQNENKKAT